MNVSRQDIYSYVTTLIKGVSSNIYRIEIPEILNSAATSNGFIVLKMDGIKDFSEMSLNTYAQTRVYIECYVPSLQSDGTINTTKYKAAQDAIDTIIREESLKTNQPYTISSDIDISMENYFTNNTNTFFLYITSFLITIT